MFVEDSVRCGCVWLYCYLGICSWTINGAARVAVIAVIAVAGVWNVGVKRGSDENGNTVSGWLSGVKVQEKEVLVQMEGDDGMGDIQGGVYRCGCLDVPCG